MTNQTPSDRLAAELSALDAAVTRARARTNADFDALSGAVRLALLHIGRQVTEANPRRRLFERLKDECVARGHAVIGDDHVSAKVAAESLGVAERTLRDWRDNGVPIAYRHLHTGAVHYSLQGIADHLAGLQT